MRLKRLAQNKGAALVWAVCAMMVLSLLVASLLAISMNYFNKSLEHTGSEKAKLLAQSGINYVAERMSDKFVPAQDWLPLTAEDFEEADGGYVKQRVPMRVYFDGSVVATLENWLSHSKYKNYSYTLDGTDVVFDDDTVSLTDSDKRAILAANESSNYAELYFALERVEQESGTDEAGYESDEYGLYILKITSVAHCGTYSAQSCAVYGSEVFIDEEDNGRKFITCDWYLIGFTES